MSSLPGLLTLDWDAPVPDAERTRIYEAIVRAVRRWRLELPVTLLLESTAPLSRLAGQGMIVGSPLLAVLLPGGLADVQRLSKLLEDPHSVRVLVDKINDGAEGMMQHASDQWHVAILVILLSLIIIARIFQGQRGKIPFIRRIAGLNAIDETVGRATEMGRAVLMVPGISGLDIVTLQALSIFGYVARQVARFGNKIILPTADPLVTGVAEEAIRDAYQDAGRPDLFNDGDVRYLTDQQFAFAIGVAGILSREKPAASFLFGSFAAESLILAEVGQQVGAVQVAGTPSTTQIPFFIAACDYVIIGDEYYAATAYISRDRTLLGSIVGQDYCKLILLTIALLGCLAATLHAYLGAHGHHAPALLDTLIHYFTPQ